MILSIDQGTTGTTVLILSPDGEILGRAYSEFRQIFPQPGWVSHNAEEIWETTLKVIGLAIKNAGIQATDIKGIGITPHKAHTPLIVHTDAMLPLSIMAQCFEPVAWRDT